MATTSAGASPAPWARPSSIARRCPRRSGPSAFPPSRRRTSAGSPPTSRRSPPAASPASPPTAGHAMRAEVFLLILWLAGCGPVRVLTRPEGNGGWSDERRAAELATQADRARVDLTGEDVAAVDADAPVALADVVRLAGSESRRVAEADRDLAIAAERF